MQESKDELSQAILDLDTNTKILENRNQEIEKSLKAQADFGAKGQLTPDSINQIVTIPDPFSEKIVHLVAKYNALEDCMACVKKGYEKDAVDLTDFLKQVR